MSTSPNGGASPASTNLTPLRFAPYDELDGRANVIVDGSAADGTVLCLSHWPGTPTPPAFQADLSAQITFRYLRDPTHHGDATLVSNNHFDQDGLVSVVALTDPATALAHEELLTDVAAAGDFGTYRFRDAARTSMVIAAYADPERSPMADQIAAVDDPTGLQYQAMAPRLLEIALDPAPYEELWHEEDASLTASERCVADEVAIDEVPELDLAVLDVPPDAPATGGHRFGGGRWSAGLHPMAINNATERTALLIRRGRNYELVYRYETWVQLRSRPVRRRVDLTPLAARLDELETGGATWTVANPAGLLGGVAIAGGGESTIEPDRFQGLVEEALATAPVAWDPNVAR